MSYTPWTPEQIHAALQKAGCSCPPDCQSTCTSSVFVDGYPLSFRATHKCSGCGTRQKEIADPTFVMPADVDRW